VKKTTMIGSIIVIIALILPMLVVATTNADDRVKDDIINNLDNQARSDFLLTDLNETPKEKGTDGITLIGKWGHGRDKDSDGFFAAKIFRKGNVGVLKGVFNESGEDERTPFVCFMKKGYLVGNIVLDSHRVKITGLYRLDAEKEIVRMQWMTQGKAGWAVGRIRLNE
jgi:hypothetical protein